MPLERKYERDIDIFLAEEFSVSPSFASWFLSLTKTFAGTNASVADVFVSKSDNTGESDLVVIFRIGPDGEKFALLIEDKIDAPFQPDQCFRYRLRAEQEIKKGQGAQYSRAEVILCAPSAYLNAHVKQVAEFDATVPYERIALFLDGEIPKSNRNTYRARFIGTAASKTVSKYEPQYDAKTDEFWKSVYVLVSHDFTDLGMKEVHFTRGNTWISFRPHGMPSQPKLVNVNIKGSLGVVDLTFARTLNASFNPLASSFFEQDMTSHQTGDSTSIRITTCSFKTEEPIESAMTKARISLEAASRLVRFYRQHSDSLMDAATKSPLIGS